MKSENILSIFSRLSGIDEENSVTFRFICETAQNYILSHLKPHTDMGSCSGRLEFAAAALAYYRYLLWSVTENGDSITIGEVSVKNTASDKLSAAVSICEQAFADISDVFDNGNFVFQGV